MIETISLPRLAVAFLPAAAVVALMWRAQLGYGKALYAIGRMLVQLLLIGYALVYIFGTKSGAAVLAILLLMVAASSWIALNTVAAGKRELFAAAFISILGGGGATLLLTTQGVLALKPWFAPAIVIPLAGMVFASAMTAISIAAERLVAEQARSAAGDARRTAFHAAMIPIVNSLLAVGLVSLPGMMTGQILSGVSPLVAVRYQIMVMCMIFGATGLTTASFLYLTRNASAFKQGANSRSGEPAP